MTDPVFQSLRKTGEGLEVRNQVLKSFELTKEIETTPFAVWMLGAIWNPSETATKPGNKVEPEGGDTVKKQPKTQQGRKKTRKEEEKDSIFGLISTSCFGFLFVSWAFCFLSLLSFPRDSFNLHPQPATFQPSN